MTLISNHKLFADDTSVFSVFQNINLSAKNLDDDLKKWTMNFNPDSDNQAQEVIFSRKLNKTNHASLNLMIQ